MKKLFSTLAVIIVGVSLVLAAFFVTPGGLKSSLMESGNTIFQEECVIFSRDNFLQVEGDIQDPYTEVYELKKAKKEEIKKHFGPNAPYKECSKFVALTPEELKDKEQKASTKSIPPLRLYKKLTPVDGIYYISADVSPVNIKKTEEKIEIQVKTGFFIFSLNDVFQDYVITTKDAKMQQLGKGIFLVSTYERNAQRIFSFNSTLDVSLLANNRETGNFRLFPGMHILFDATKNASLQNANMFDVGEKSKLNYIDMRAKDYIQQIVGDDIGENGLYNRFFGVVHKYISYQVQFFNKLQKDVQGVTIENIRGNKLIEDYTSWLMNNAKAEVYLKNTLLKYSLTALSKREATPAEIQELKNKISDVLNLMKQQSPELYEEGVALFKNFYYISIFSEAVRTQEGFVDNQGAIIQIVYELFPHTQGKNYFWKLSNIFLGYSFLKGEKKLLDEGVNFYVASLIENENIEDHGLGFVYFILKYTSGKGNLRDGKIVKGIHNLFQVANLYYSSLEDRDKKKFSIQSFEVYNTIFSDLYTSVLGTYFRKSKIGIILKNEYTAGKAHNIPIEELQAIRDVTDALESEIATKKQLAGKAYLDLNETFEKLKKIIYNIENYSEYILSLKLKDSSLPKKSVGSVMREKKYGKSDVQKYFSQFNGVNRQNLLVESAEGKYFVRFNLKGNEFFMKFEPNKSNRISNVVYKDSSGKKHTQFSGISVSLDDKKEEYEGDESKKFENFFEETFLKKQTILTTNIQEEKSCFNIDMAGFIQDYVMTPKFEKFGEVFSLEMRNICVEIKGGKHDITLQNIELRTRENALRIDAKYDYQTEKFSNIIIQVRHGYGKNASYLFNNAKIKIEPTRVSLNNIEKIFEGVDPAIGVIMKNYTFGIKNIIIQLDKKQVLLDGKSYSVQ